MPLAVTQLADYPITDFLKFLLCTMVTNDMPVI